MWTTALILPARDAAPAIKHIAQATPDGLMIFGFLSIFFTLVFFFYQHKSKLTMQVFALCLASTAVYGLMEGDAALSLVSTAWSASAIRGVIQDMNRSMGDTAGLGQRRLKQIARREDTDSRISRMFGPT